MSDTDSGDDRDDPEKYLKPAEKANVLSSLYGQLDANHHHHNTIIFQAYNLSVIFFGSIGSVIVTTDLSRRATAGVALFGSFVMFMLWFWAFMYLQGRRQIKKRKERIVDEFLQFDEDFGRSESMDSVEDAFFFKHDETMDEIRNKNDAGLFHLEHQKDTFQWAYFVFLGLIFAGVAAYLLVAAP
jgi:hypothetical protein